MKDFTLPIWISNYLNRNDNCEYPHSYTATDAAMLKKLVEKDHVFISFKNNYRNKTNFQHTDRGLSSKMCKLKIMQNSQKLKKIKNLTYYHILRFCFG